MLPPGPPTPAFWQTYRFLVAPRDYSLAVQARYGRVTRFRGLNGNGIAIADPDLARDLFAAEPDTFETPSVLFDLFGEHSVLATSGERHRRQRKLLNPRFHGARMKAFLETMQRVVHEHLGVLRKAGTDGSVVTMSALAQRLTLDVILETVFGEGLGLERERARGVLRNLMGALSPTFVFARALRSTAYPLWRTFLRRRREFDAWVDGLIADRRKRDQVGSDILGVLLDARYDDGGAMEDGEIRDLLMTLLLAGHETTAIAVAWGVYWLLREPVALARLRSALDSLDTPPSPEAIVRLPYLEAVIAETLRVEPIVTDVARICRKPLELGPWVVPAGEIAIVNVSAIFADEALFPEAHRFRPERFLDRALGVGQFMPFGGGHRRCLGAAFAEAELAITLATFAREWELELAEPMPERSVRRNITMGPQHGVRVRVLGARPDRPRVARAS
ncbi:MAG: cytochrome P450 [Polyangiaceae bacterium]|jgi:cytochrome P450